MSDDAASLIIVLEAQSKKLQSQLVASSKLIDGFAANTEKRFASMQRKTEGSFNLGKIFEGGKDNLLDIAKGAIPTVAALLSVTGAFEGVKSALEDFRKISEESKASGLDPEFFQGIAHQAEDGGVGIDAISAALEQFNKNSGQAEAGTGRMVTQLKFLDPELLKSIQLTTSQSERLKLVADAIAVQTDKSKAAAIATAAFGESGQKLVEVFAKGRDGIAEAADEAQRMGLIVSDQLVAGADDLSIKFDTATKVLDLQFKRALVGLAPLIVDSVTGVDNLVTAVESLSDPKVDAGLKRLYALEVFGPVGAAFGDAFNTAADAVKHLQTSTENAAPSVGALGQMLQVVNDLADNPGNLGRGEVARLRNMVTAANDGHEPLQALAADLALLGKSDPNLQPIIAQLQNLITTAQQARAVLATGTGRPDDTAADRADHASAIAAGLSTPDSDNSPPGAVPPPRTTHADPFKASLESLAKQTDELKANTAAQAGLNPLVDDYGAAVDKAKASQDLLSAAQKAGISIGPALRDAINSAAQNYADADVAAKKLAETQDTIRQQATDLRDTFKDVFSGVVSDLRDGKSAADIFADALNSVADKLISVGTDALFGTGTPGSSGNAFGVLGQLLGLGGGGGGGGGIDVGLPRFANGGIANKPSIFGDDGTEAAVPLPDGRRIPVDLGGAAGAGGVNVSISIPINAAGADPAAVARLTQVVAQMKADLPSTVVGAVRKARKQGNL